jgi:hypothetical protein
LVKFFLFRLMAGAASGALIENLIQAVRFHLTAVIEFCPAVSEPE